MRNSFFLGLVFAVNAAASNDEPKDKSIFEKDIHAEAQAWQFSGADLAKGQVATVTAKGEWKANAIWTQNFGAGGNPKSTAGLTYLKPYAKDGCLLIRTGDKVYAFSSDDDSIVINTPGKIYFCINDEPTADGAKRFKEDLLEGKKAKDYVGALPIPAPKGKTRGGGFLDNTGSLHVRLVVKKAEK